jgi:hypothetical protein
MPDIPSMPDAELQDALRNTLKASEAVKQGIATHAEKHATAKRAQHAKLEADRKLTQQK